MIAAISPALGLAAVSTPWRRHLAALALAASVLIALFARDAAHMATIWWTSSTFNHCLLILPIVAWLVWQRTPALATLTPTTWRLGLVLTGAGGLGWMLGDAAGVALLRHAGLVVMLQGSVATLLGRDVGRALGFPLVYMLFLIPAGEELVPTLQGITAHLSMALLGLAGIPAHVEGVFITTPGGYFEVAEACSGVKFLVAMFALGVLVAHLGFRSWPRQLAFVAAALIVPILANGVRAFATIYVAGKTNVDAAAGFDHIVFGWFFFGIIIAALLGLAWRFFDRAPDAPLAMPEAKDSRESSTGLPMVLAFSISLAAAPLVWSSVVSARSREATVPAWNAPKIGGWSQVDRRAGTPWMPRFAGADRVTVQRYRDARGREVDLVVAAFAGQAEGRELVGFGQGAVAPDSGWSWSQSLTAPRRGRADRIVTLGVARDVLTFYRIGRLTTGNDAQVKLATLEARLLGGSGAGAAVLISTEAGRGGKASRAAVDDFLVALGPVETLADAALGR